MTKDQLLRILLTKARENGFQFRTWYRKYAGRPWSDPNEALTWLCQGSRANLLLFSHEFGRAFFRSGERLLYVVPPAVYQRSSPEGTTVMVRRRAHTRHSSREDVWRYHLRQMVVAEEPLRYIRRYLLEESNFAEAREAPAAEIADADGDEEAVNYDDELLVREAS